MNKEVLSRFAVIEDLERIVEIYNSTIESRMVTADLEPVSVESKIEWFYSHTEQRPMWVFEVDNVIVGWAGLQPFHKRKAYEATAEVSIYLAPETRGLGLGRVILNFVMEEASDLGVETLIGLIFAHNEPSIRLFESEGFETWGYFPEIALLDGVKRSLKMLGKKL